MVNEKEALYCREVLDRLGFKVFYSGGGHYHHARDYGDFHVLLNGLNDIDDCGELVTDRKSMIAATFDHESDCTSLMFHSLNDAVNFFTDYEINKIDPVGEAEKLMEAHGFEFTSTGGNCFAYLRDIDGRQSFYLVTNTAGLDTYPQSVTESVSLILDREGEQIAFWDFDDLTSALAFADVFVTRKGE